MTTISLPVSFNHLDFYKERLAPQLINNNDCSIQYVTQVAYELYKPEIKAWFSAEFPHIDFDTYEDGIDDWFGLGSVMLFELGIKFALKSDDSFDGYVIELRTTSEADVPRKKQVLDSANSILDRCPLLTKTNCTILHGFVFEYCKADGQQFETDRYRMFFSTDDYDYLHREDEQPLVDELNRHFGVNVKLAV